MNVNNPESNLETVRHSAAHVMAEAVLSLFPDAKFGIGPNIEDGFYYDFDLPRNLTPEDLPVIEKKMKELIKARLPFNRQDVPKDEARKLFAGQPYKLELIDEIEEDTLGVYTQGNFTDLCRGPHLETTGGIRAIKLLSIAGAYWRGDEKNPMLQRIYGTAFESKEALNEYLNRIEEAKKRDHRKLGRELDLFLLPEEIGGGLVILPPKGG
ncbi:MAG: threonine--tRNA ligase, partial [Dehalococcoidales bacterium]|nr:threonine--tRNA ligase [Dehalococcoidales bacterium]